jgi:Zn-dependent M28 family amino/carboxypeptidase
MDSQLRQSPQSGAVPERFMYPTVFVALLVALQSAPVAPADTLVAGAQQLAAGETNDARFDALTSLLRRRSLRYSVEPFSIENPVGTEPRTEGRNVVVALGAGAEELVIGAHYDAARLPDGSLSRGAVDNAASTVILVQLVEALRNEKLPFRVKVVWFDMEELGLIGSARYVESHTSDRIVAMLNFDVNGYGETTLFGPSDYSRNESLRRALVQTCAAEARDCVAFPQMPPGDDRSFVSANVPTLSIATLPAVEAHQLWLLMNANQDSGLAQRHVPAILRTIHTSDDVVAKLDGESMARTLRFALALVRNVGSLGAASAKSPR